MNLGKGKEEIHWSNQTLFSDVYWYSETSCSIYLWSKDFRKNKGLVHPSKIMRLHIAQLKSLKYIEKELGHSGGQYL